MPRARIELKYVLLVLCALGLMRTVVTLAANTIFFILLPTNNIFTLREYMFITRSIEAEDPTHRLFLSRHSYGI